MVEPFCLQRESGDVKHQFRSLPSVSVLSSAFVRHAISSFRAFAVPKTHEIVWRSYGRSFFGARRRWREFFCAARAQYGSSWYYQSVRSIEFHFTFLAFLAIAVSHFHVCHRLSSLGEGISISKEET